VDEGTNGNDHDRVRPLCDKVGDYTSERVIYERVIIERLQYSADTRERAP
jgi:hypothetical protein